MNRLIYVRHFSSDPAPKNDPFPTTKITTCVVTFRAENDVEQNDENGLDEENCDSSNVSRNMKRMSKFWGARGVKQSTCPWPLGLESAHVDSSVSGVSAAGIDAGDLRFRLQYITKIKKRHSDRSKRLRQNMTWRTDCGASAVDLKTQVLSQCNCIRWITHMKHCATRRVTRKICVCTTSGEMCCLLFPLCARHSLTSARETSKKYSNVQDSCKKSWWLTKTVFTSLPSITDLVILLVKKHVVSCLSLSCWRWRWIRCLRSIDFPSPTFCTQHLIATIHRIIVVAFSRFSGCKDSSFLVDDGELQVREILVQNHLDLTFVLDVVHLWDWAHLWNWALQCCHTLIALSMLRRMICQYTHYSLDNDNIMLSSREQLERSDTFHLSFIVT